jgi:hypothetical protein
MNDDRHCSLLVRKVNLTSITLNFGQMVNHNTAAAAATATTTTTTTNNNTNDDCHSP